jgi:uncharacterized membrane protein HdeD (DUF308 family)
MTLQEHVHESEQSLAHIWKAMAFRGLLAVAFSIVIIVWPNIGVTALIALFGAFALVFGIATIVGAFSVSLPGNRRAGLVIEGLLGIAVGVVVFVWPNLSALGLLYAIAIWAIAIGLTEIVLSFELPISGKRSLLLGLSGVLSIAFGAIMFAEPGAGAIAVLALIAAFLLVTGVMQIVYAFELRRVVGELERPFQQRPARPKLVTHG